MDNIVRDQETWLQQYSEREKWIEGWEKSGPSYTIIIDGKIIACAGVVLHPFNNGEAWTLFSQDFYSHVKGCYQEIKKGLDRIMADNKLKRVEALVDCRDGAALNFIEHLGFKVEGKKKKYGPNGEDMFMFARIS